MAAVYFDGCMERQDTRRTGKENAKECCGYPGDGHTSHESQHNRTVEAWRKDVNALLPPGRTRCRSPRFSRRSGNGPGSFRVRERFPLSAADPSRAS